MYLLRKMVLAGLLFSAGVNMFAQESAYAYDANGNLTKDLNKNIVDIQYNSLNLPSRIVFKVLTVVSCVRCGLLTEIR